MVEQNWPAPFSPKKRALRPRPESSLLFWGRRLLFLLRRNLRMDEAGKPNPQTCGEGTGPFFARRRGRGGR